MPRRKSGNFIPIRQCNNLYNQASSRPFHIQTSVTNAMRWAKRSLLLVFRSSVLCSGFSAYDSTRNRPHICCKASSSTLTADDNDDIITDLPLIKRIFCLSDLHVDREANLNWVEGKLNSSDLGENDLVVIAGDISHSMGKIKRTFSFFLQRGIRVLFLPGNHEAWLSTKESERGMDSFGKLQAVETLCKDMGVLTGCVRVGGSDEIHAHPLWIIPLQSWYDGSLTIKNCEDLCQDFSKWPWVDFIRCAWTDRFPPISGEGNETYAKIPIGLARHFIADNKKILKEVVSRINGCPPSDAVASHTRHAVLTASHFLPNQRSLPDWKDLESDVFHRDEWLAHGAAGMASKFAKVAGTSLLDDQIRNELRSKVRSDIHLRQIHVFGHSHRPKDFEYKGIRYVHNPLGKPRERDIFMVSPDVDFQLIWDTTSGEIPGRNVIRFWEEQGGGVEALRERLSKTRRRKSRYSADSEDKLG